MKKVQVVQVVKQDLICANQRMRHERARSIKLQHDFVCSLPDTHTAKKDVPGEKCTQLIKDLKRVFTQSFLCFVDLFCALLLVLQTHTHTFALQMWSSLVDAVLNYC